MVHVKLDKTKRTAYASKINPKKTSFNLSRHEFFRIIMGTSAVLLMAALAFYFEQYPVMWIAIIWALGVGAWQTLFYGYAPNKKSKKALSVTNFYSKGVLIFLAFFWSSLIIGISIALYYQLP